MQGRTEKGRCHNPHSFHRHCNGPRRSRFKPTSGVRPLLLASLCRASHCLRWKGHMNTHAVVEDEKRVETAVQEHSRPATMGPLASAAPDHVLFEVSLLDSSVAQRKRRTWSTLLSFVLQLFLIGLLLLLPLWFTEVLPKQQLLTLLEAPPPPPPPPPAASASAVVKVRKVASNIM